MFFMFYVRSQTIGTILKVWLQIGFFYYCCQVKSIFIYSIEEQTKLLKVLKCHKDINKTNTLYIPLYYIVIYHQCHITHKQFIFLIYRESRVRIKRLNQTKQQHHKKKPSNLNQEECISIYILIEYHRQCIYDTTKREKI